MVKIEHTAFDEPGRDIAAKIRLDPDGIDSPGPAHFCEGLRNRRIGLAIMAIGENEQCSRAFVPGDPGHAVDQQGGARLERRDLVGPPRVGIQPGFQVCDNAAQRYRQSMVVDVACAIV